MSTSDTLESWGEFRLLNELILPLFRGQQGVSALGDDCAFLELPHDRGDLVITTDAAPKPVAWTLGHKSYWTWGWYAVLVNVSDLASAAAEPIAFTASVEAPSSMAVDDFRAFFEGLSAACREMGIKNAGGNLRAAPRLECHGTAIGVTQGLPRLGRGGCRPGDLLVSIGECGLFAQAYLKAHIRGLSALSQIEEQRLRPFPRIREMQALQRHQVLSAASDNSDGILGSLWNIAERSLCSMTVEMDDALVPVSVREVAMLAGVDPWNLMFCWGDWQIVASVASSKVKEFDAIVADEEIPCVRLGHVGEGPPGLFGIRAGERRPLRLLRNENFVPSSFNTDVLGNVDFMLRTPLFGD